jgi:hypothetical protein
VSSRKGIARNMSAELGWTAARQYDKADARRWPRSAMLSIIYS